MSSRYFTIDPSVIHEVIDGEAVMISLTTGNYYIVDPIGAEIWSQIERSAGETQIVQDLSARFASGDQDIATSVGDFLDSLLQESLISETSRNGATQTPSPHIAGSASSNGGATFAPPKLEKFSDMQDLILIDPIHDVDEAGWPHAKPEHQD